MEMNLQIILITGTIGLILFIVYKVKKRMLELRYSLLWLFAGAILFLLACFPGIVDTLSRLLHIQESVNTIFLLTVFFLILIILSLTGALSGKTVSMNILAQELGLLKMKVENLSSKKEESEEKKEKQEAS